MSKVSKFMSLGIDIMHAFPESKVKEKNEAFFVNRFSLDEHRMEDALNALEAYFAERGEKYEEPETSPLGSIELKAFSGRDGKDITPVLCEVRLYPVLKGDDFKTDYEATGRIDFLRFVTKEDGTLFENVPSGRYLLKVSKGTEYEIHYEEIEVYESMTTLVNVYLNQFMDLEAEGFIAGDLHHHSIYSSPVWGGDDHVVDTAREVANSMQALGLKYGALSDHHNIFNHEEWKSFKTDSFYPIPSKEISTSNGHVLSLGVDGYDVIYKIPKPEERTDEYLRNEFVRITDEIKAHGGLPQLNHPRDRQKAISWNPDFYDLSYIFETIEIWNGSNPMYYGTTNALAGEFWRMLLEKGLYRPITTGSDTHNIKANDYHALCGRIRWIVDKISTSDLSDQLSQYKNEIDALVFIKENILPQLEVWAKTSLTSGCNRTYVNIDGKPDKEKLLNALRSGHSFLTNGPALKVTVGGVSMGDTLTLTDNTPEIKISLRANRKVNKLIAYTSKNRATEILLKELPEAPFYDYSLVINDFDLSDTDYIFFVAAGGVTNLAITNPVLIKH